MGGPPARVKTYGDIAGWFRWLDRTLFDALLAEQQNQPPGDLVELGAYLGKSAVVIGAHLRPGERFIVVDLFEDGLTTTNPSNRENSYSYRSLTRQSFEENYLSVHADLPTIVQNLSSTVTDHVAPGTVRFVHIDASHYYENVALDTHNAERMLRPGGVVVLDDYRSEHTPGVAAAAWEAAASGRLIPFLLTPNKFYAATDNSVPYAEVVKDRLNGDRRFWFETQSILGHTVLRAKVVEKSAPPQVAVTREDLARATDDVVARIERSLGKQAKTQVVPAPTKDTYSPKRIAREWLPPAITKAISRHRRHQRQ